MPNMIECPDCAGDIPMVGDISSCPKCGAEFRPRIYIRVKPHEFRNPVLWAKAHLKAADQLLNSLA